MGEPPSDGSFQDKLTWFSETAVAERFGDDGVVILDDSGSTASSEGVADAVFDLGLPPAANSAFTTKVYVSNGGCERGATKVYALWDEHILPFPFLFLSFWAKSLLFCF